MGWFVLGAIVATVVAVPVTILIVWVKIVKAFIDRK